MSNQNAPTTAKIDVLEKAKVESLSVLGSVGDVVLALNVGKGDFDWQLDAEIEYHYCVRGTTHYQLKHGDQELPPITVSAGESLTIPAGVAHRGYARTTT